MALDVRLYGEHIGTLSRWRQGSVFEPSDLWSYSRYQPTLGLSWTQQPGSRAAAEGLPSWFSALLPERGSALRSRLCEAAGVSSGDEFGLLGAMGTDLPGAVLVMPLESDEDGAPIGSDSASAGSLHFSLAGMQLKFSLAMREQKLVLPLRGEQGSFIAKLPGEGFPALPAIESLTMSWARACGFQVPDHQTLPIEELPDLAHLRRFPGELCLVVARFDRSPAGPVHQEDFCQAFGQPASNKYSDQDPRRVFTFASMVRLVRDACGAAQATDLVRRIAFTLASGNSDAHLQNWSLQHPRSGGVDLAPLYDQVSVIAFPRWGWDRDGGPTVALPFGGRRSARDIDRAAVAAFAREAGDPALDKPFIEALLLARDTWLSLQSQATHPHRDAIEAHWLNVPLLASLR